MRGRARVVTVAALLLGTLLSRGVPGGSRSTPAGVPTSAEAAPPSTSTSTSTSTSSVPRTKRPPAQAPAGQPASKPPPTTWSAWTTRPPEGPGCQVGRNGGATDIGVTGNRIRLGMTNTRSGTASSYLGEAYVAA